MEMPNGTVGKVVTQSNDSAKDLHNNVVERASEMLDTDSCEVYGLFRGKVFGHMSEVPVHALGMHDGCCVSVMPRLLGGVCVRNRAGGTQRKVSFCFS